MNRLPIVGDRYDLTEQGMKEFIDACPRTITDVTDSQITYVTDKGTVYKFSLSGFQLALNYYWIIIPEAIRLPQGV